MQNGRSNLVKTVDRMITLLHSTWSNFVDVMRARLVGPTCMAALGPLAASDRSAIWNTDSSRKIGEGESICECRCCLSITDQYDQLPGFTASTTI